MSKWGMVKLGDVCLIERGGSPRPIDKYITTAEDGINWIKIGDTTDSMYITKTKEKIIREGMKKSRFVNVGDFLLSNSMSFGRPYILKIEGCIHDGWLVIRDERNLFEKRFLYYFLSSPITYNKFKQLAVGGVVNNLNSEMVRKVNVPIPPFEEQKRIADILDKASNLIDLRKQQLEKMDLLIKSKFIDMFGNPVTNPKGWEKCEWKKVFNTATGKLDSNAMNENGKYPFFTCSKEVHFIDTYAFDQEALLLAGNNATANYDVKYYSGKFNAYQRTYILTLKECNNQYCFFKILLEQKLQHLQQQSKGSNTKYLTMGILDKLDFILPPTSLQNQFAAFVEQVEKQKAVMQQSLEKMEMNYKALMQEYFG